MHFYGSGKCPGEVIQKVCKIQSLCVDDSLVKEVAES